MGDINVSGVALGQNLRCPGKARAWACYSSIISNGRSGSVTIPASPPLCFLRLT